MKVIMVAMMAISHSGVTKRNARPMGNDRMMAVNKDSCLGERFFALNIKWVHP